MAIINGDNSNNILLGTTGDDTLNGLDGNDQLYGNIGLDIFNGGNGNDLLDVVQQFEILPGETYNGGLGFDTLRLFSTIDLTNTIINADVEAVKSQFLVVLTAAQLGNFSSLNVGNGILLTSGGVADLSGASIQTAGFFLNNAGNTLILSGVTDHVVVNGGTGNDVVVGGDSVGDTLNGGSAADVLDGGLGDDRFVVTAQGEIAAGETYNGGFGFDVLDLETAAAINLGTRAIGADIERLESGGAVSLRHDQLDHFTDVATAGAITLTSAGAVDLTNASRRRPSISMPAATRSISPPLPTTTPSSVAPSRAC